MTNLDVPASGDGEFYQETLGSPIQQVTSRDQEEAFVWKFHRQQSCSVCKLCRDALQQTHHHWQSSPVASLHLLQVFLLWFYFVKLDQSFELPHKS